jgi:hypothetical protein
MQDREKTGIVETKLTTSFMNERTKQKKARHQSGEDFLFTPKISDLRNHTVESSFLKNVNSTQKESISAEMAASVVSQYVLPMFEKKRNLKSKYSSALNKHRPAKSTADECPFKEDDSTVYGELKLSSKLQIQLS